MDETGLITGVAEGETTVTVTSNQTGVSATVKVTVVALSGPQPTAYTVSGNKDALISFNPNLPSKTETVSTFNGGSTILAMTAGDGCLYYVQSVSYSYYLYRYDLDTKESAFLGGLYSFTTPASLAYDEVNNLFYVTAGFYLFQFDGEVMDGSSTFNMYKDYRYLGDYESAGVVCIDGSVYLMANYYWSATPRVLKYEDKYLQNMTEIVDEILDLQLVQGVSDFSYDPASETFYMADGGSTLYSFQLSDIYQDEATGKNYLPTTVVDLIGDGSIDVNGLAILPASEG